MNVVVTSQKSAYCLYRFTNVVNGKMYIGQTRRDPFLRKEEHRGSVKRGCMFPVHCAMRKYGFENFDFCVLPGQYGTKADCDKAEIDAIRENNSLLPNGYNVTEGGDGASGELMKIVQNRHETRLKRSLSMKEAWERDPGRHAAQSARLKGNKNGAAAAKPVVCLTTGSTFPSLKAAAEAYGVNYTKLSDVLRGHRRHTGGLNFVYGEK